MDYNLATLYAATGSILKLPLWQGEFFWDYGINLLMFRNEDYISNAENFPEIKLRKDWYYII